jgi:hypothetical protein
MPTVRADDSDAWRHAGELWPLDGRPRGAPAPWNPSGLPEPTQLDGDGAEPLGRVNTWPAAMVRQCAAVFRPDRTEDGGRVFTRASTCDRKEGT